MIIQVTMTEAEFAEFQQWRKDRKTPVVANTLTPTDTSRLSKLEAARQRIAHIAWYNLAIRARYRNPLADVAAMPADLLGMTGRDIIKHRGVGKKCLAELKTALSAYLPDVDELLPFEGKDLTEEVKREN